MKVNQAENSVQKSENELKDVRKNGKVNDWRGKKLSNLHYASLLSDLHYKKFERVKLCAEIMKFEKTIDSCLKLTQAWFCKSRLCALCNWRRSMKHAVQVIQVIDEAVKREPKGRFVFLTLTTKNVWTGKELNAEIARLSRSFNKLVKYKKIRQNLLGYLRAVEVTVNSEDGSYNQHIHALLFVRSSYFTGNGKNYISQREWADFWQRALKEDYTPVVDVRAVKPKKGVKAGEKSLVGAAQEVAKYPVKSVDYLTNDYEKNLKRVEDLEKGLKQKRLISYGGLFKDIRKELQLKDVETDDDLIRTDADEEKEATTGEQIVAYWNWQRKNYYVK